MKLENNINDLINNLSNMKLDRLAPLFGFPLNEFKGNQSDKYRAALQDFINGKSSFFDEIYDAIDKERDSVLNEFNQFYNNNTTLKKISNSGKTLQEVIVELNSRILQIERLKLIYNPTIYKSKLVKKGYKLNYNKVRIVWIDDNGVKNKDVTRTYGDYNFEEMELTIKKMLIDHFGAKKVQNNLLYQREFDFLVEIKNELWGIETKIKNGDDFIKTAVRLDLWQLYKKTYDKKI